MLDSKNQILFNQKELAEYLGTTVDSLNSLRYLGRNKLPYIRWGNRLKFRKSDVDAWIEANLQNKGF